MATATRGQSSPNPPFLSASTPTSAPPNPSDPAATTVVKLHTPPPLPPPRIDPSLSPRTSLSKTRLAPRSSPVALTGVAAMADMRKRKQLTSAAQSSRESSPNPAVAAIQSLMGSTGMSKPSDAPPPPSSSANSLSEPMQHAAERIHLPPTTSSADDAPQVSPVSVASFGTTTSLGGPGSAAGAALTATTSDTSTPAIPQFVAEPAEMGDANHHENGQRESLGLPAADDGTKAYSYPGPPPHANSGNGPSRGASLPGYGQTSPKSPATNKRHKCPYCETDFTRHHNLKSHLLTHSQEKPYVCQTCPARFRRLHDLKRHTKLHTGERPHICDKCGRKFARGDALARHNKGPGGCAGRRSSFGGEDDFGVDGQSGESMEGVEYTGDDDETSSPEQGRRESEPNRKRIHIETSYDPDRQVYRQQSSTYPPVYPPPPPQTRNHHAGDMGPPQVVLSNSNPVSSPHEMNSYPSPAGASSMNSSYYAPSTGTSYPPPGGMTESPKPISPGHPPDQQRLSVGDASMSGTMHRNRSPSLTTQFQQAHFGRGSGGRTPPSQHATTQQPPPPLLPPLGSQPPGRGSLQPSNTSLNTSSSGPVPGPSLLPHTSPSISHPPASSAAAGPIAGSNPSSLSSHGQHSSTSSMRDVVGHDTSDLWAYVRSLEARFSRMQDEYELRISRLQEEVITLRGQVSGSGSTAGTGTYSNEIPQPRY